MLDKLYKLKGDFAKVVNAKADALKAKRDWRAAIEEYKKAEGLDSRDKYLYSNMGKVNTELGDIVNAIKYFKKAVMVLSDPIKRPWLIYTWAKHIVST